MIPKATLKINDKWECTFRLYLEETGTESTEYWYCPNDELHLLLSRFWFAARTPREALTEDQRKEALSKNEYPYPEHYSIASLRNLQNGLSCSLVQHRKNIDLTTDPSFKNSQSAFKDACKELKKLAKELFIVIQKSSILVRVLFLWKSSSKSSKILECLNLLNF